MALNHALRASAVGQPLGEFLGQLLDGSWGDGRWFGEGGPSAVERSETLVFLQI